jgi:hypothetical protein
MVHIWSTYGPHISQMTKLMTELMTEVASNLWRVSGCNEVKRDRRSPTRPKRFEVSESDSPGVVRPESEVNQWSEKQVKSRSWALRWAIWWFWCDLYWCINDIQTLFDTHYYHYSFNFFGSISTCQFWSSSVPASWTLLPQDVKFHRGICLQSLPWAEIGEIHEPARRTGAGGSGGDEGGEHQLSWWQMIPVWCLAHSLRDSF